MLRSVCCNVHLWRKPSKKPDSNPHDNLSKSLYSSNKYTTKQIAEHVINNHISGGFSLFDHLSFPRRQSLFGQLFGFQIPGASLPFGGLEWYPACLLFPGDVK